MTRRQFATSSLVLSLCAIARAEDTQVSLRGKLLQGVLTLPDGKKVQLTGDDSTNGVLHDSRLDGVDLEVIGSFGGGNVFHILPIHKHAMFVHQNGKRLFVSYWCAVCSIRTYTPGNCLCCQENTALDLLEKLDN